MVIVVVQQSKDTRTRVQVILNGHFDQSFIQSPLKVFDGISLSRLESKQNLFGQERKIVDGKYLQWTNPEFYIQVFLSEVFRLLRSHNQNFKTRPFSHVKTAAVFNNLPECMIWSIV